MFIYFNEALPCLTHSSQIDNDMSIMNYISYYSRITVICDINIVSLYSITTSDYGYYSRLALGVDGSPCSYVVLAALSISIR